MMDPVRPVLGPMAGCVGCSTVGPSWVKCFLFALSRRRPVNAPMFTDVRLATKNAPPLYRHFQLKPEWIG